MTSIPVRKPVFAGKSFDNLKGRNNDAERRRYSSNSSVSKIIDVSTSDIVKYSHSDTSNDNRSSFCQSTDDGDNISANYFPTFDTNARKTSCPPLSMNPTDENAPISTNVMKIKANEDACSNNSITIKDIAKRNSENEKRQVNGSRRKCRSTNGSKLRDSTSTNEAYNENSSRNSNTDRDCAINLDTDFGKGLNISDHTLNKICWDIMARNKNNQQIIPKRNGSISSNSNGYAVCQSNMQAFSCPSSPSCRSNHDNLSETQLKLNNTRYLQIRSATPRQHKIQKQNIQGRKPSEQDCETSLLRNYRPPQEEQQQKPQIEHLHKHFDHDQLQNNRRSCRQKEETLPPLDYNKRMIKRRVRRPRLNVYSDESLSSDVSSRGGRTSDVSSSRRCQSSTTRPKNRMSLDCSSANTLARLSGGRESSECSLKKQIAKEYSNEKVPVQTSQKNRYNAQRLPSLILPSKQIVGSLVSETRTLSEISTMTRHSSGTSYEVEKSANLSARASAPPSNRHKNVQSKVQLQAEKYMNTIETKRDSPNPSKHRKAIPRRKPEPDPLKSFETSRPGVTSSKACESMTSEGNWDKLKRKWGSFVSVKGITHDMRYTFRGSASSCKTNENITENKVYIL